MLRDVLGDAVAEEVMLELNNLIYRIKVIGWRDVRPWSEFFGVFKPPQMNFRHVEQRIITNFLHYRSNYLIICLALVLLRLIFAPFIILTLALVVAAWTYAFVVLKSPVRVLEISIDDRGKQIICGAFTLILLTLTGSLERLLWTIMYCIAICGAHLLLRPRSVTSKANALHEDFRFSTVDWFGSVDENNRHADDVTASHRATTSSSSSYSQDPEQGSVSGYNTENVRKRPSKH